MVQCSLWQSVHIEAELELEMERNLVFNLPTGRLTLLQQRTMTISGDPEKLRKPLDFDSIGFHWKP